MVAAQTSGIMRNMAQRLMLAEGAGEARGLVFIAARAGEGTSKIARDYAGALAQETHKKILLIDAAPPGKSTALPPGLVDSALKGRPFDEAVRGLGENLYTACWVAGAEYYGRVGEALRDQAILEPLLAEYDRVIIDAPALERGFDGVMLAAKLGAAVMVVEAEKTPQAVARNLRDTLQSAGVNVLGMVFNKRRFYIPGWIYKRL